MSAAVVSVAARKPGRRNRPSGGRQTKRKLFLELLEDRRLLAGMDGLLDSGLPAAMARELVVIDSATPGYQSLLDDLVRDADSGRRFETLLIDANVDGVSAIGQQLAQHRNWDALHIVSHGTVGGVQLGNTVLSAENLPRYADSIQGWSASLNRGADILFYGCDVAGNETGREFVNRINELTAADVAASIDITGSPRRGGDWDLEFTTGTIETPIAFSQETQASWDGQLAIAQTFYVPLPENELRAALLKLYSSTGSTIDSSISLATTANNTIIYYDHWEDGYETDIESPTQATTQIWGDNDPSNGIPPGFATDILTVNDVITLRNLINTPRNSATILYDARDKIVTTRALAVTRFAWATTPGPVLGGAVEVTPTCLCAEEYVVPVGENAPFNEMFEHVSLLVMAVEDNTTITIDTNGPAPGGVINLLLNEGQSYHVNGGIQVGATVTADKAVQSHLMTGDIGTRYESRWFTLYPLNKWSSNYYNPVGTTVADDPAATFLYNPNATAITINYSTLSGSGTLNVPANGVVRFQMPANSGANFYTNGSPAPRFFAVGAMDADTSGSGNNVHDWGFTLVPDTLLTPALKVGAAPGAGDQPISVNGSPVWVIAEAATRVYANFDGDPTTGSLTDPNGNKYDQHFDVQPLQSLRIFDPDKDQTGMRIYTVSGVKLAGAWGQDPANAGPGNPYLDLGYSLLPQPVFVARKSSSLTFDGNANGAADENDVIEFTIEVRNDGVLPIANVHITDPLPANTTYVLNSTAIDAISLPDDLVPPASTAFPLDEAGVEVGPLAVGEVKLVTFRVQVGDVTGVTEIINTATIEADVCEREQ